MAKKTIPDGLIVKGARNLLNRFSPEAEKYARYKVQKKRGTYDDKKPSFPEPVYKGATAEETANMNRGFNKPEKPKTAKKQTPRKKQSAASSITDANLALRTGKTLDEASALKEKRRTARKQYLRNFASQLARGEQAAPIRGFGEGDGNPANDATLAGASAEVAAKKAETDSFAENILSDFTSIGNDNSDLLSNDIQSLGSFESEDSSPITYMKKEYRKKRGY